MSVPYRVEPLGKQNRQGFRSGSEDLDRYIHRQAGQDMRRALAACFVAIENASDTLAGFYTLSAASIPIDDLPDDQARRLPGYPHIPAALLGRLAIDQRHQGCGLGASMLFDALRRTLSLELGIHAVIVDAKDEAAQRFYEHHGFVLLPGPRLRLMMPIATARKLTKGD